MDQSFLVGLGSSVSVPMTRWAVGDYLLAARGVLLLNVENVGYRVANDSEKVEHAERFGYSAAIARMQYGNRVLNSVDRSKVSPARRRWRSSWFGR